MSDTPTDPGSEITRLREENERLRQALVAAETRKGVQLAEAVDWEEERQQCDVLLEPLRSGPLGKRLATSTIIHVALLLVTSLGFLFLCLKHGSLDPRAAQAAEEQAPKEDADGQDAAARPDNAEPPGAAPDSGSKARPGAANASDTGKTPVEKAVQETSTERPTESDVDLFDDDFDVDLKP